MHSNGCTAAMTGLIIARLNQSSNNNNDNYTVYTNINGTNIPSMTLKMTTDEESWFGRCTILNSNRIKDYLVKCRGNESDEISTNH